MNKLMFLMAAVLLACNYLLYSFIIFDFNIYDWDSTIRTIFGVHSGIILTVSPGLTQVLFDNKK